MNNLDKRIIIKNKDGGCSVVFPASVMFDKTSRDRLELDARGTLSLNASDDQIWEFIKLRSVPEGLESRIIDVKKIPTDRTFRDAWTDNNPTETVDVDMSKAREIHKEHLRQARKPLLEQLDVDYQRADELKDEKLKKEIASRKQELRDITKHPDIEKAQTPEELKLVNL